MLQFNFKKNLFYLVLIVLFLLIFLPLVKGAAFTYDEGPSLIENSTWYQELTNVSESALVLGDIDNDGDLDLALSGNNNRGYPVSRIYTNNGTSLVENSTWGGNLTNISFSSLAFGDIDNDGDLDLALTGCNKTSNTYDCTDTTSKIYENNGTSFVENSTWQQNLVTVYYSSLAFGDIDNDGDLDLALSGSDADSFGYSTRYSKIYLNNGTSLVESTQWQQNLTDVFESAIAFGDVDNDGDLDLVMTGDVSTSPFIRITKVYLNNDTSLVEDTTWQQGLLAVDKSSISFGDFDNDGDLDFNLIGCCDHDRLYVNNGTSFEENQSETGDTIAGVFEGSISWGDYDNDGDLDLAIDGREGYSRVYNNNNTIFARTTRISLSPSLMNGATIVWADLDNDSDLDIIEVGTTVSAAHTKIYTNNLTNNPNEQPTPPIQFTNYTTTAGNIHLGWGNGSDNETPSNGLYYNLRLGTSSGGNQIISGKYGGGEDNGYFGNMMQRKNLTLKSTRLSTNTKYFWSVQTIDTGLRTSSWSAEQSFNTSGDLTPPTITLNAPANNYYTNTPSRNITFNATVYDNLNVTNVTLWGNWTGSFIINITNSSGINNSDYIFTANLSGYNDGHYLWGIQACDNSSLCEISANRTFSIDTHYPNISIISPSNSSTWTTSSTVTFQYNVTDLHISNCSLIIDSSIQETDYSISTDTTQTFTKSIANGDYNWNINCTDEVNYQNSSVINKLTVSYSTGGGISTRSGIRAYTKPIPTIKEPEKPIKKIPIKEEHLKEIKLPEKEPIKEKVVSFFETIFAFIISLFIISSYIWIIKEDFRK